MLRLQPHQHAMLKEMGIDVPDLATHTENKVPTQHAIETPGNPIDAQNDALKKEAPSIQTIATPKTKALSEQPEQNLQNTLSSQAVSNQPVLTNAERAKEIAAMSWQELEQAVSTCNACPLCKSRTQAVLGVGSHDARWMIVGEAPGEQEDKQGEPFVGQAGKLLDKMLEQLNIARRPQNNEQAIYIGNVLKCRPPHNRNPDPQEMLVCEPFLKRQIELLAPKVILAMGRFAVQALLQSHEAIGKLRGKVHTYQNIPVVVTYHPAYLLRNPSDKRKSWADLCLAADIFEKQTD